MEAYSSSSSSSSKAHQQQLPYYTSSLHSVRKVPSKSWKKPVAPLPPTPPRVYKVDPINFRDLVQRLTAAPEFQANQSQQGGRLQAMAPPPVDPINFRDLVQRVTAAPEFQADQWPPGGRLQAMAPPPVDIETSPLLMAHNRNGTVVPPSVTLHRPLPAKASTSSLSPVYKEFSDALDHNKKLPSETTSSASSFLELNLSSPASNSHNWCSYPLLSPGTRSSLEQSTVL